MLERAPALAPYRPHRPSPRATAREFLLTVPRAWHALRARSDPRAEGAGTRGAVLVIPALFCGDWQTAGLRAALARAGYASFGWGLGTDWGPTPGLMDGVEARLQALSEAHGPAALIGLSMGGLFCRWLALRHPGRVRQVITVCSPFRAPLDSFWMPWRPALKLWPNPGLPALAGALEQTLPVPTACLFSRRDGIVAWESCRDPRFPGESFEIAGSHVTMANDPSVHAIVLEQLAAHSRDTGNAAS
nr:alpha/beta fold hydrolase [uncultured Rhodopila sp.]